MIEEPILEIEKIQGNILPGFRLPHQVVIACKVKNESNLNDFIKSILPKITSMKESLSYQEQRISLAKKTQTFGIKSFSLPNRQNLFWLNIAFGRHLIASFNSDVSSLDNSFSLGLAARSFLLGDPKEQTNEGNRSNWIFGNEEKEADIFLIVASDSNTVLENKVDELKLEISRFGIQILYSEKGERLNDDTEHFGFKDGVSQPEVRGFIDENKTYISPRIISQGNNDLDSPEYSAPGKLLLWAGQFIFGYPKQSASHFRNPIEATELEKSNFIKNGSFLVFRRLKQNVKAFYADTKEMHQELIRTTGFENISYDNFLAKLVGRNKDGIPLVFEGQEAPKDYANNFNFKSDTNNYTLSNGINIASVKADPQGVKCPMFAHIRKVNPRDIPTDQGAETNTATFRIMRRGIPFGKPYNFEDPNDDSNLEDRGLLFLCYQSSIQNQFELLTNKWTNKDSRPESVVGHDILVGQNNEEDSNGVKWCMFSSNGQNKRLEAKQPFVIPTGGGYFFCPSIEALTTMIKTEIA
jgi:Dyp-type peroxidase family